MTWNCCSLDVIFLCHHFIVLLFVISWTQNSTHAWQNSLHLHSDFSWALIVFLASCATIPISQLLMATKMTNWTDSLIMRLFSPIWELGANTLYCVTGLFIENQTIYAYLRWVSHDSCSYIFQAWSIWKQEILEVFL
jgi:hypothetical protein